ncbi:MAG: CcoQ/FixQ family Cbb3-type cytochrome c oxidase assembly chaperone [Bdellovibrionales bacterium]|nr:CcoQ/FixQ family Cbb3-type cytochrome c oxidase assembly chaperone [Bdellovibrionales bacterium]
MGDIVPVVQQIPVRVLLVTPLLLLFFVGLMVRVYRGKSAELYNQAAKLPLEE